MKGCLLGCLFLLLDCEAFCVPETAVIVFEPHDVPQGLGIAYFENIAHLSGSDEFWSPLKEIYKRKDLSLKDRLRWNEKERLLCSIRDFMICKEEGKILAGYYAVLTARNAIWEHSYFYKTNWVIWMNFCEEETEKAGYDLFSKARGGGSLSALLWLKSGEYDELYSDDEVEEIGRLFRGQPSDSAVGTDSRIPESDLENTSSEGDLTPPEKISRPNSDSNSSGSPKSSSEDSDSMEDVSVHSSD